MRAAILLAPGSAELRDVPVPQPGQGEVVLHVEAALTCGTDLKTYRRGHPLIPLPAPMGHEFAGIVAAVGDGVRNVREGDAVAATPTAPCGHCRLCRRGRESLCPEAVRHIALGGFAEYVRIPANIVASNLFVRPAGLPAETAAALEPLACVVHGVARLDMSEVDSMVLIGDGPIALLFLQLALLHGAGRVLVAGRHAQRLELAKTLGADKVTDAHGDALADAVDEWTGGVRADAVVECVGTTQTWEAAPALAAVGGTVLLYGGCPAGTRASFDTQRVHYEEVDLKGAFHYDRSDVKEAWRLITGDRVKISPLISHRRPLESFDEAWELALSRAAMKVALLP
jgi:L-iditol 2-dehydrogenase